MQSNNVIDLELTIKKMKKNYLYNKNMKYIKFCKNIYGIDHHKWDTYFWQLYVVMIFEEELKERFLQIDDIENIAKDVANKLKMERERIIIYNYIEGYINGYTDTNLISSFSNVSNQVFEDKKINEIYISDIMKSKHIKNFSSNLDKHPLLKNVESCISNELDTYFHMILTEKLNKILSLEHFVLIKQGIYDIILKDCIQKYKDGIWDGVIIKSTKNVSTGYNIVL